MTDLKYIIKSQYRLKEFANLLEVNYSTLWRKMNNQQEWTLRELLMMTEFLDIEIEIKKGTYVIRKV